MVRKISIFLIAAAVLIGASCATVSAATHTVYDEGTLSTTYVTYFRDIVSGIGFNDNYIAFRSGQYSYTMVVGDLEYNKGSFTLNDTGTEYVFTTSSGYNSQNSYTVNSIGNFSVSVGDNIIYSDLGNYPQLVERGAKYEIFTAVLLCVVCVAVVFGRFFRRR